MSATNCYISYEQVNEAFLKAPPAITASIKDKSITHPNFEADLPEYKTFPLGQGVTLTETIHRGSLPEFEIGLGRWKKMQGEAGCNDCVGPDCGYNWSVLGGNSFDSRTMVMMERDFRSQPYCIKTIQTTHQYEDIFAKIVDNIFRQIDFHKEFNIVGNVKNMLSKKYVVDSDGIKTNRADPFTWPALGSAVLSALNIYIFTRFYQMIRRQPDAEPFDVIDGKPVFAVQGSEEIFADMYRDDPNLREDIRWSSQADALLTKYNFMYTIRGMFIIVPSLYPPRYNAPGGVVTQIAPFVNGIPAEVGEYSSFNPDYENAAYEGLYIHGKHPFALYSMPTASSLGQGTDFGPEVSWFDNFKWINPETEEDPFRRSGWFATHATLGVAPQSTESLYQLLVPRTGMNALFTNPRQPTAPATSQNISNSIPSQSCPCPQIKSVVPNPITAGRYFFEFYTPITGSIDSNVTFGLTNGGSKVGVLKALAGNNLTADIDLGAGWLPSQCLEFVSIFCQNTLECSSYVLGGSDCRSSETGVFKLYLEAPIKAVTAGNTVTAIFGNGTTTSLSVVSVNMQKSEWTFRYASGSGPTDNPSGTLLGTYATNQVYLGNSADAIPLAGDFFCDRGLPRKICVPTATDNTCPACTVGPTITQCA